MILSIQVTGQFVIQVAYKCVAETCQTPQPTCSNLREKISNARPRENRKPQMLNWNPLWTKTMIKRFSKVEFYKIDDPFMLTPFRLPGLVWRVFLPLKCGIPVLPQKLKLTSVARPRPFLEGSRNCQEFQGAFSGEFSSPICCTALPTSCTI